MKFDIDKMIELAEKEIKEWQSAHDKAEEEIVKWEKFIKELDKK